MKPQFIAYIFQMFQDTNKGVLYNYITNNRAISYQIPRNVI